jgi:hypothetical protein
LARVTARRPDRDRVGVATMGVVVAAVLSIAVVGAALFVVFSQPRPVWRDAAEHSRWFWLWWMSASVVVGLIPAVTGAFADWGAIVWLEACCAFAIFQPAMIADVLEVRRDVARRRHATLQRREFRARAHAPNADRI